MNNFLIILLSVLFSGFCFFVLRKRWLMFKKQEINLIDFIETVIISGTCLTVQGITLWAVFKVNFQ